MSRDRVKQLYNTPWARHSRIGKSMYQRLGPSISERACEIGTAPGKDQSQASSVANGQPDRGEGEIYGIQRWAKVGHAPLVSCRYIFTGNGWISVAVAVPIGSIHKGQSQD